MTDRATNPGADAPEPSREAASGPSPSRSGGDAAGAGGTGSGNRRRRGSRGGRGRKPSAAAGAPDNGSPGNGSPGNGAPDDEETEADVAVTDRQPDEIPERLTEGRPKSPEVAEKALVRKKPQIGDRIPPEMLPSTATPEEPKPKSRRRRSRGGRKPASPSPVEAVVTGDRPDLDDDVLEQRRGRERKGRPVGRYLMCVSVRGQATHIAVLEGRTLIEHYVSRPSDDVSQIHGNIYLGRVQNVLPGMEAAFVDIGTPKNAVLYRGDVQYDQEDIEDKAEPRIEHLLKAKQPILCQVTKNPIAHKGARLTTEVSLPGRFVVMIPNSPTVGISKRLADDERKRLRRILDKVRPDGHGLIVRTAAEGITSEEIEADVARLTQQWERIA
jgi:ribonuclease E